MEAAVADLLSIARLPPGHDPGAGYGVATAARQRWHLAIRHFGLFGGPVQHHRFRASELEAAMLQAWRVVGSAGQCRQPMRRQQQAGLLSPGLGGQDKKNDVKTFNITPRVLCALER